LRYSRATWSAMNSERSSAVDPARLPQHFAAALAEVDQVPGAAALELERIELVVGDAERAAGAVLEPADAGRSLDVDPREIEPLRLLALELDRLLVHLRLDDLGIGFHRHRDRVAHRYGLALRQCARCGAGEQCRQPQLDGLDLGHGSRPPARISEGHRALISARRFWASRTPSAVGTRGSASPRPLVATAPAETPTPVSASATAAARRLASPSL